MSLESRSITPVQENPVELEPEAGATAKPVGAERQASEERSGSFGSAKAFAESGKMVDYLTAKEVGTGNNKFLGPRPLLWLRMHLSRSCLNLAIKE